MKKIDPEILKQGTLNCPICNEPLHFEIIGKMRIVRNGLYDSRCPKDNKYFYVKADDQK